MMKAFLLVCMLAVLAESQYYDLDLASAQANLQKLSIVNDRLFVANIGGTPA
jgi:hypothetical protein